MLFVSISTLTQLTNAADHSDIGYCDSWNSTGPVDLDCMLGPNNFCCNKNLVKVNSDTNKWSKACCSEIEFVEQNM